MKGEKEGGRERGGEEGGERAVGYCASHVLFGGRLAYAMAPSRALDNPPPAPPQPPNPQPLKPKAQALTTPSPTLPPPAPAPRVLTPAPPPRTELAGRNMADIRRRNHTTRSSRVLSVTSSGHLNYCSVPYAPPPIFRASRSLSVRLSSCAPSLLLAPFHPRPSPRRRPPFHPLTPPLSSQFPF